MRNFSVKLTSVSENGLLSLVQAGINLVGCTRCPLKGRDEAALHRHTCTNTHSSSHKKKKFNSRVNRQANAHKLVHVFAHKLTETGLFSHAS